VFLDDPRAELYKGARVQRLAKVETDAVFDGEHHEQKGLIARSRDQRDVKSDVGPMEFVRHNLRLLHRGERCAAADILGWKRILEQLRPRTLDKSRDPAIGELLEVDLSGALPQGSLRNRARVHAGRSA
jgi:hypothetical protein